MKAIKTLAMAALATAVFASCSNDEDLAQSNYPMDNVVRIMTSVDGMNTRASYGNSTDKLKSFGFCIKNANSENIPMIISRYHRKAAIGFRLPRCFGRIQLPLLIFWLMRHIRRLPKMQMAKLKSSENQIMPFL